MLSVVVAGDSLSVCITKVGADKLVALAALACQMPLGKQLTLQVSWVSVHRLRW